MGSTEYLKDLHDVGTKKSLGYLPLNTLKEYCQTNELDIIRFATENGLKYFVYSEKECGVFSGAIYVYHEQMVSDFLDKYKAILEKAGVPTQNADRYVDYVAKNHVDGKKYPEAYAVVGKTFNDKRFRDAYDMKESVK